MSAARDAGASPTGSAPGAMDRLAGVEAVTFDCYGTLVDWERGILWALEPVLGRHEVDRGAGDVLALFGRLEAEIEDEGWQPYREVLREVVRRMGRELDFRPTGDEEASLVDSLTAWPLFPDTGPTLRRLAREYRLGIVSNVDDDLFAGTARSLGVAFDVVVTAEETERYKPDPEPLREALRRLDLPAERVLHAAQSRFHDVGPARELGFVTAWVDRPSRRPGAGATREADAEAHVRVESLEELAGLLRDARDRGGEG